METSNNSRQAFFSFSENSAQGIIDGDTVIPGVQPEYNTINKIAAALENTLRADNLILNSYGGMILDSNGNILIQS